jgi:Regulator of chromosome condensation (RCC1) repeat
MFKIQLIVLGVVLTACGNSDDLAIPSMSAPENAGGSATVPISTITQVGMAYGGAPTIGTSKPSTIGTSAGGNSSSSTTIGGSAPQASGGSAQTTSEKTSTGGTSTTDGKISTGGSSTTGGKTSTGGSATTTTGGHSTTATGGSSSTTTTDKKTSTGGSSTSQATGGSSSTGDSSTTATGGSNPGTSGSPSTGGSSTTSTGGNSSTGGSSTQATGGNSSTGGSSSTTTATGGSNPGTGGYSSTGGSSTATTGGSNPATSGSPSTGGTTSGSTPVPVQVSVGRTQTCVVLSDGTVKCWGSNDVGQLGNGTTTDSQIPVLVNGISNAIQVSTYFKHSCALLADGTVKCWGMNTYGQLGNEVAGADHPTSTTADWMVTPNPVQMVGVTGALQVTTGGYTTCVVLADHTVKCVGYRRYGTLGDGIDGSSTNYYSKTLVQVIGIDNAISISSNMDFSCALLSNKTTKCWGTSRDGEFPLPTGAYFSSTPVLIPNVSNAIQLSIGTTTICYSKSSSAYCWGSRIVSKGTSTAVTPEVVAGALEIQGISLRVSKIVVSASHACALFSRPELTLTAVTHCWGSNTAGELGDGTTVNKDFTEYDQTTGYCVVNPTPDITDAIDLAVSSWNTGGASCAVLRRGTMKCWGIRTGNSSAPTSSTPVIPDGF